MGLGLLPEMLLGEWEIKSGMETEEKKVMFEKRFRIFDILRKDTVQDKTTCEVTRASLKQSSSIIWLAKWENITKSYIPCLGSTWEIETSYPKRRRIMTDVHIRVRYFGGRQTWQERKNGKLCYSSSPACNCFWIENLKTEKKTVLFQELALSPVLQGSLRHVPQCMHTIWNIWLTAFLICS